MRDAQGNVLAIYSKKGDEGLKWDEQHLYGSSRLGMWRYDTIVPQSAPMAGETSSIFDSLLLGSRSYELSNHLGNVLATISDKKMGNDSSGVVNYYIAEVLSQNDYYPGGMLMPGRSLNSDSYRYSINGQEKTPEIAPNTTTAEFWQYDARIVRRWNVDPIAKAYESPYATFANNPINLIDPNGTDTLRVLGGKNKSKLDIIYGKGTALHTYDIAKISYLPNTDIGQNTIDLTGLEDPDLIGIDLSGSANLKWLGGQAGVNLLWKLRGEKKGDQWVPELHTYAGGGVYSKGSKNIEGSVSASVIFGYANTYDKDGNTTKASADFVANGYNWTGNFWTVSGSAGVLTASKFWAYDPSKGKPNDGGSYWSGFSIGVGRSLSLGKSNAAQSSGKIMKTLASLSGNAQIQYYYLLYGDGSDYLPETKKSPKKDVSGWNIFNPIDPKDTKNR